MANSERFKQFIQEIAGNEVEWQYEDGTGMNDDAYSFMEYVESLENKVASQPVVQTVDNE